MKRLVYFVCLLIFSVQAHAAEKQQDVIILKFMNQEGKPLVDQPGREITDTFPKDFLEILPSLKALSQGFFSEKNQPIELSLITPQDWLLFKEILPLAYEIKKTKSLDSWIALHPKLASKSFDQLVTLASIAVYFGQVANLHEGYFQDQPLGQIIDILVNKHSDEVEQIQNVQVREYVMNLKNFLKSMQSRKLFS